MKLSFQRNMAECRPSARLCATGCSLPGSRGDIECRIPSRSTHSRQLHQTALALPQDLGARKMQRDSDAHPGRLNGKVIMKDDARGKTGRPKALVQPGETADTASGSARTKSNDALDDGPRGGYGEPETTGLSQLSDIVTLESAPQHANGSLLRVQEQHSMHEQVR